MQRYFLLLSVVSILSSHLQSQMTNVPGGTISTPGGTMRLDRWVYRPVNMIKLSKKKRFNPKDDYEIRIVLLNDSVFYTGAKLDTHSGKKALKYDGKIITPDQTKEIVFPVQEGEYLKGLPRDSCWVFKTTAGTINVYSTVPEVDAKEIVAMQKLTGEILPFSKELLLEWLKLDPKAVKLAEKDKYLEAIKTYNQ